MTGEIAMWMAAGAALGAAFALLTRRAGPRRAARMQAAGLVVAGLAYVAFALRAGDARGAAVEAGGTVALALLAAAALRWRPATLLALGWALHPLWDVALHTGGAGEYAPRIYVILCIGFDLVVAGFIAGGWAGVPRSPASPDG